MKKAFLWILTLLIVGSGSFALGRLYLQQHSKSHNLVSNDWDNGFCPAQFPCQKHSFVIFVSGFNNGAYLEKTLRSVFSQVYDNYRLIYIDDASTDGSFELARDCIAQNGHSSRAAFIHNEQRLGFLANLVRAVQVCKDHEIIVVLHDQDWLAHEWVLDRLNHYYADPDLWLTYGQYREFPSYHLGNARNYQQSECKTIRHSPMIANHLPAFYAALFKRIKESDLLFQGAFLADGGELAMMLPMLEMAQDHFQFITEVLSISNQRGFCLENRDSSVRCERYTRSLKSYLPLTSLFLQKDGETDKDHEAGS